jgi:hypothetical protein
MDAKKCKQGFRKCWEIQTRLQIQTRRLRKKMKRLPDYVSYGNLGSGFIETKANGTFHKRTRSSSRERMWRMYLSKGS